MTTVIEGDNWCLEGANPKERSVSTQVDSALHHWFRCTTAGMIAWLCASASPPWSRYCTHGYRHVCARAYTHTPKYMHTVSHPGEERHTQCLGLLMGTLIFEGLTPSSLFLWLLIHRSKRELPSAFKPWLLTEALSMRRMYPGVGIHTACVWYGQLMTKRSFQFIQYLFL